jgi:hypothetical protein
MQPEKTTFFHTAISLRTLKARALYEGPMNI